jgi:hypothetical protein
MVTRTQKKRLLAPFRKRYTNACEIKSILFRSPVTHLVAGLCLAGSSDKDSFYPTSFIWNLYDLPLHTPTIIIGPGRRFGSRSGRLSLLDEDVQEVLNTEADREWKRLMSVTNLLSYLEYLRDSEYVPDGDKQAEFLTIAALGDFDAALAAMQHSLLCDNNAASWQTEPILVKQRANRREFARRLESERNRVYELLHEWEAHNAKMYGISEHWSKTPFPGELAGKS